MSTRVDDVGSFPLPPTIERKTFDKAYIEAREAIINGEDIRKNEFLLNNFYKIIVNSFQTKQSTGLDVINYPQHFDMHEQFAIAIHKATNQGTYIVEEKEAIIPEVHVISQEAKALSEETEKPIRLRISITGPMELYLREIGTALYKDVLLMFAETVNRFAKNSILKTNHVKTEVISIDEPSFGLHDILADRDVLIEALEKAFQFTGVAKQIHLHSVSRITDTLKIENLDVLSFEYAASHKNIESLSKRMLEEADKHVRIGISRTDINSILAELHDKGITKPTEEQLVENEETIKNRFLKAKEKYDERLAFVGPDCGLGGWPSQESAQLLLKRTVKAVKASFQL